MNNVLFARIRPAVAFTVIPIVRFDRSFAIAFYATSESYYKRPLNRAALAFFYTPERRYAVVPDVLLSNHRRVSTVSRRITFRRCVALVR